MNQSRTIKTRLAWVAATVLIILHYALAVGSKFRESTTSDEVAHIVGGYTYWKFNDYRFQPENGNLPQRWAALPTWLAGAKAPAIEGSEAWRMSDAWAYGEQFFYETGEDHFPRLMAARAMIALFSAATGALVFAWSRSLFGMAGGLVSLGFFAFCPSFLAHGALATSDICMVFLMLASTGLWWRHLHDGSARSLALSAAAFALACVAKFSAVLLIPMIGAMILVRSVASEPLRLFGRTFDTRAGRAAAALLSAALHGAAAVFVIWASFGFRYSAFNPALPPADQFFHPFGYEIGLIGWQGTVIRLLARWHALPEAYLYGYSFVVEMSQQRGAFLNGEYSVTGWPSFFPWTFVLKTTLPLMAAMVLTLVPAWRRWSAAWPEATWRRDLYRLTPLLVLFGVYWAFSVTSHLNIGHRHILPTYPVLFIGAGVLGTAFPARRIWMAWTAGLLLAWHASEALATAPHFIAYFNELSGGPANASRHLVDSSLDWGQDLPGLEAWLNANNRSQEPVYLSYFGTGEPAYYNIRAARLPFIGGFRPVQPYIRLTAGWYCISATMLAHVYSPVRGPWTIDLEREYQQLRALDGQFEARATDPIRRAELDRQFPAASWSSSWTRFQILRLARLCTYLRVRRPDANVGHSILLYHLSHREVADATGGSVRAWKALIEQAVANPRP